MFAWLLNGDHLLSIWLGLFVASGIAAGVVSGYFKARKIQPKGFKWTIFRNEALFAVINLAITGFLLGTLRHALEAAGAISFAAGPALWWRVGLEYALYFFLFDTYFYWLHRWMHKEPVYSWVHKLHHRSTSPNLLTTLSVSPLESLINGGFVPLFLAVFTVHDATVALIVPTNIIMGLYVHSAMNSCRAGGTAAGRPNGSYRPPSTISIIAISPAISAATPRSGTGCAARCAPSSRRISTRSRNGRAVRRLRQPAKPREDYPSCRRAASVVGASRGAWPAARAGQLARAWFACHRS